MREEKGEEVVKIGGREEVGEGFGHERGVRFGALGALAFLDGQLLAGGIHKHDERAFFPPKQAGDGAAILEREDAVTKDPVHVAVRIEHVLAPPLDAAVLDVTDSEPDVESVPPDM